MRHKRQLAITQAFALTGPTECIDEGLYLPSLSCAVSLYSPNYWHCNYSVGIVPALKSSDLPRVAQGYNDMADYQQYLTFMYTALEQLNKKGHELSETTDLVADIGLSSLEVMELIEMVEDHFDISIPLNILPDVNTIGELAKKVQEIAPG
jgi:acyl carrier protein